MESRIDRYIDGELSAKEAEALETEAAFDAGLRLKLARARIVKDSLAGIPSYECPPDVEDAILKSVATHRASDRGPVDRMSGDRGLGHLHRRLVPALGVFLLIAGLALFVMPRIGTPSESYTNAEVQQALQEVRYALGIVGHAGATTAGSVRDEVFENNTLETLRIAVTRALGSDNQTNR